MARWFRADGILMFHIIETYHVTFWTQSGVELIWTVNKDDLPMFFRILTSNHIDRFEVIKNKDTLGSTGNFSSLDS